MPTSTLRVNWLRWLLSLLLLTGVWSASANALQPQATLAFVDPTPPGGQPLFFYASSNITFVVKAQSTDVQAPITLSSPNLPAGATLPTTTSKGVVQTTFSWTPDKALDAEVPVTFLVTNSQGEQLTLNVLLAVHSTVPPVFIAPTPADKQVLNVVAGNTLSFVVRAYDPKPTYGGLAYLSPVAGTVPKGASVSPDRASSTKDTPTQITFTWTPTLADVGTYTVGFSTFSISDTYAFTSVTIVVGLGACDPALTKPVANDDVLTTTSGSSVTFSKSQLLANDTNPQGQALQVAMVGQPGAGTLTTNADGSYTYTPFGTYTGRDVISYLVQPAGAVLASPATGHYYEFVSAPGLCWADAKAAAAARTYNGLKGYLATVTSDAENAFLAGRMPGRYWLGASDAAVEGEWRWQTGPEAGQLFWQGAATGTAVGYSRWNPGEPNDYQNQYRPQGEDYAEFYGASGYWNDLDNCHTGDAIDGYLVEYGGLESCTPQFYATGRLIINIGARATARTTTGAAALVAGTAQSSLTAAPNPSNGQFSVQLTAAAAGPCRLELLDMQGRRVRTLLDAPLQAGESRTLDVNAAELANGLYMVRLQNAAHVQTLRVSVVR